MQPLARRPIHRNAQILFDQFSISPPRGIILRIAKPDDQLPLVDAGIHDAGGTGDQRAPVARRRSASMLLVGNQVEWKMRSQPLVALLAEIARRKIAALAQWDHDLDKLVGHRGAGADQRQDDCAAVSAHRGKFVKSMASPAAKKCLHVLAAPCSRSVASRLTPCKSSLPVPSTGIASTSKKLSVDGIHRFGNPAAAR